MDACAYLSVDGGKTWSNVARRANNMDAWDRLCVGVDGFWTRYNRWPTRVRMFPASLECIRNKILTDAGYALVTAKVELVPDETAPCVAEDADGRQFNYDNHQCEGDADFPADDDIPAEEWFGNPDVRYDEFEGLMNIAIFADKYGNVTWIGKDVTVDPDAFPIVGIATGENYESNVTDAKSLQSESGASSSDATSDGKDESRRVSSA